MSARSSLDILDSRSSFTIPFMALHTDTVGHRFTRWTPLDTSCIFMMRISYCSFVQTAIRFIPRPGSEFSAKARIIRRKEMLRTSAASVPAATMMIGTNHVSTTMFATRAASKRNHGSMSALRFDSNAPNRIMISVKK